MKSLVVAAGMVLVLAGANTLRGGLLNRIDPKNAVSGVVKDVDTGEQNFGMVTSEGQLRTFHVSRDTRFTGPEGSMVKGLKDERMAKGFQVQIEPDDDGKTASKVHLLYPKHEPLEPFRSKAFVESFKAGERANVIVIGNGRSYLSLSVYDAQGNCVAHDEGGNEASPDDLAVEWYPAVDGPYSIEVRNLSRAFNNFKLVVR